MSKTSKKRNAYTNIGEVRKWLDMKLKQVKRLKKKGKK